MSKYNFDDSFVSIENEDAQIIKVGSPWGNSFVSITLEDIEALKAGKVLCHDSGEYCTFVKLKQTGDIHKRSIDISSNEYFIVQIADVTSRQTTVNTAKVELATLLGVHTVQVAINKFLQKEKTIKSVFYEVSKNGIYQYYF